MKTEYEIKLISNYVHMYIRVCMHPSIRILIGFMATIFLPILGVDLQKLLCVIFLLLKEKREEEEENNWEKQREK